MTSRSTRRAPGPRGLAMVRAMRHFMRDPLDYMQWLRQFGEVVRTSAGPFIFHSLFHPDAIRHVFVEHPDRYSKRGVIDDLNPLLGKGLITSKGDLWRRRRGALNPELRGPALEGMIAAMDAAVGDAVGRLRPGEVIDAVEAMMHLALAVVGNALFGVDLGDRVPRISAAVEQVSRVVYIRSSSLVKLPLWVPMPRNRAYLRACGELKRIVDDMIAEAGDRSPFINRVAGVADGDPNAVRDEVLTFLIAGHETTASTLAWAIGSIARDPAIQERARAEATATLDDAPPSTDQLGALHYLDAIVSETLRLYPPGWIMGRRAEEADEVLGFAVPRNGFMIVPVHAIHRLPERWPDPTRFDPARFLDAPAPEPLTYLPFGAGPRRCIGETFARYESRLLLARLLARFRLQPVADLPPPAPLTTLRPAGPVRVQLASL